MEWDTAVIMMVAIGIPLVLTGIPISVGLLAVSIVLLTIEAGPERAVYMVTQEISSFWMSWTVLPIPLFVLMGELLFMGGSAGDIFDMVSQWMRRLRGGLALVSVGACAIFASMSGSSAGATGTLSAVTIPEMLKRGYSRRLSCGCIAGAGALAHLIPPSMLMVVYASLVEISPGRALMSAFIPGFILAGYYAIIVAIWATIKPDSAPKEPSSTWKEKFVSLRLAWQPILLILAVMGTLYAGIATATEASAMGALAALILTLIRKHGNWRKIPQALIHSARVSCFIMLIAASGKVLALTMAYYAITERGVNIIMGWNLSPTMTMVTVQVIYLFLGCFLDPIGIMVITLPVMMPVLLALGFNPYWFGVMCMVNFEIALVTPPMGPQLYIIKGVVPEVPLKEIILGAFVFLIAPTVMLVTLYIFPNLALWLPSTMLGK